MTYPPVLNEVQTMTLVSQGRSLARYGDGEFNLCWRGLGIPCQRADPTLRARLVSILMDSGECLVGIPNLHSPTPKAEFWAKYKRAEDLLVNRDYVSAFVTRPDSAPWIDTPDYWAQLESLWLGRDVTLVRGSARSLTNADLVGAKSVREIVSTKEDAWWQYADLLDRIGHPERALLCLGPTATVLAVDLCARGVHAVDLGHIGMFLRKHRVGAPMIRTEADKVA